MKLQLLYLIIIPVAILIVVFGYFFAMRNKASLKTGAKGKLTLAKDQPQLFDGSTTLTLTSLSLPRPNCRDCMTDAQITVEKNGQKKEIGFQVGGISGKLNNVQEIFNYTFTLEDIKNNKLVLLYTVR